jgi:hypothetical protein
MAKKWIAINLVLLLGAGLLGWRLVGSVKSFEVANDVTKIVPDKQKAALESGLPPLQQPKNRSEAEFAAISSQNLFAESRKLDDPAEVSAPLEAPPLDLKPILRGVIIAGSDRKAMIIDPSGGGTNATKIQTMHLGDSYRGFIVTDITEDQMVLELGTRREIIPLYDASKRPVQGGKTPIIATRIVNFGPPLAQQGIPGGASVVASAAATASRQTAQQGGGGSVVRPAQAVGSSQPAIAGRGGPARGQQVPAPVQMSPGQGWNQTVDAQGRIFINSPFGQIPVQTQTPPPPATKK